MADQAAGPQSTPTGKFSTAYLRQLYTPTNLKAALDGDPPFSRLPVIKDSHRLSAEPSFKSKVCTYLIQHILPNLSFRSLVRRHYNRSRSRGHDDRFFLLAQCEKH